MGVSLKCYTSVMERLKSKEILKKPFNAVKTIGKYVAYQARGGGWADLDRKPASITYMQTPEAPDQKELHLKRADWHRDEYRRLWNVHPDIARMHLTQAQIHEAKAEGEVPAAPAPGPTTEVIELPTNDRPPEAA